MSSFKRKQSKAYRQLMVASAALFWWSAACGSNPKLVNKENGQQGGAGLGEACKISSDCAESLVCGPKGVCIGECGDTSGTKACGSEACLESGRCSEGLGRGCQADSDCADGLVCSEAGHCSVPCEPDAPGVCRGGAACRSSGTCPTDRDVVIGVGGAPNDGGGGDGAGGAAHCIDVTVDFTPQIPSVVLLIDRSGSMNADNFGAAVKQAVTDGTYTLGDCPLVARGMNMVDPNDWRWNVVRDVLMNPTKGIIKPLEDRVRFGLSLYTSRNGQIKPARQDNPSLIEIDPTKVCPELIDVPIALNNHQAMLDEFKCSDIADDTPTGESLIAAAARLKAFTEPGPKLIVLATDGEPDNCECPNFSGHVPDKCKANGVAAMVKDEVVATAKQIHADDITIHVINVSTPGEAALQKHLEDVATAGGGQVYPGFSPGALSKAFDEIIDGVRSCVVDLNGEIADGKEATGTVTLDGKPLELGSKNGWRANSPTQIELLGSACEAIKSGDHDLDIQFPCESFEPVVH